MPESLFDPDTLQVAGRLLDELDVRCRCAPRAVRPWLIGLRDELGKARLDVRRAEDLAVKSYLAVLNASGEEDADVASPSSD